MKANNRIALVTGAYGGVGRAVAQELNRQHVNLLMIARSQKSVRELRSLFGQTHKYFACDLSDQSQILSTIAAIKRSNRTLDMLINVAAIGIYEAFSLVSRNHWDTSFAINVTAPFLFTRAMLPLLKKKKNSVVINVGSGSGVIPTAGMSTYCATKFAIRGWTLSLAREYKKGSPRFHLLTLGSTLTGFGGMTIEEKKKERRAGKAFLTPTSVAKRILQIIANPREKPEATLFPT